MTTVKDIAMPECERMVAVAPESQKIGHFLDWLEQQGIYLATWQDEWDELTSHFEPKEQLLARYFEIDLDKVEAERRALLEELGGSDA